MFDLSRRKVGSNVGLWRDLKGFDAVAAVFSGRGVFRKQKPAVFSAPHSPSFSFHARFGLLSPDTPDPFWTLRKDPSLFAA